MHGAPASGLPRRPVPNELTCPAPAGTVAAWLDVVGLIVAGPGRHLAEQADPAKKLLKCGVPGNPRIPATPYSTRFEA